MPARNLDSISSGEPLRTGECHDQHAGSKESRTLTATGRETWRSQGEQVRDILAAKRAHECCVTLRCELTVGEVDSAMLQ